MSVLLREEAGGSLLEFTMSVSLLMMVVFAIMGFSLEFYADHFVAGAAQAAARYAMVRGSTWGATCTSVAAASCSASSSNITTYVQSIVPPGVSGSGLTVTSQWPGTTPAGATCANLAGNNSPGCTVSVTVKYAFATHISIFGQDTATLTSTGAQAITQ